MKIQSASKRDEILASAQKVFAQSGYKEATIRQICKAARANVCLVSYYFGGKAGLYRAIFESRGASRLEAARDLLARPGRIHNAAQFRGRLNMFLETLYEDLASRPEFFKLMGREMIDGLPRAEVLVKNYVGAWRDTLEVFLGYGRKKKFLKREVDIKLLSLAIMNTLIGFMNMQLMGKSEFFFKGIPSGELQERILITVSTLVFEGVLA